MEKVRVGFGMGTRSTTEQERFTELVDALERLGFDSLWLSERISGPCPDPMIAMTFAAARTTKLKFGTSVMVLPGRNPMLLAKEMATLDRLSGGRLLPAFGLGIVDPAEQQAFGVERTERAGRFNELLPLLRRFWTEDSVDHDGRYYRYENASVLPRPVQQPISLWLGGASTSELRRTGRLGDGWLPSFCTPDDVRSGLTEIVRVASDHDREFDLGHVGALVPYANDGIGGQIGEALTRRRPDLEPTDIVADGIAALVPMLEAFIEAGASKFVVVPLDEPEHWTDHLEELAAVVKPLQN